MTENNNNTVKKVGFFKRVKTEFKKIVWPSREDVTKETLVVVIATIVLGTLIALVDFVVNKGIHFWTNL